ncbi:DUF4376 domain-containing protein [Campylobacter estrildidarum]|uniref:DUF4376 domain-containing protein n=1 Tax=Campylobacter estrildidarum TaxID=2510189 RepID=A0A4U7BK92_9BACT|nr:DUF4376 domain-containing protein [Campylobacter estrildidarum]TKX30645.1 hypothetical protein CQA69_05265 [Campylobacter estrildidarum]
MFYLIKEKKFYYEKIFCQELENGGENFWILENLDNEDLRKLGLAKVIEHKIPEYDKNTQNLNLVQDYDELKNEFNISYKVEEKSLEQLKDLKLKELKTIKEQKLLFMPYKNTIFQIDTDAKINISGKVSEIVLAQLNQKTLENINWIDKNNQIIIFSASEFLEFGISIAKYTEEVIFKNDTLRNEVKNASSSEELKKIQWENKE